LFIVHKYLGWEAAVAYPIVVAAVVALNPRLPAHLPDRTLFRLALITFLLVVIAFVVVYPIANTNEAGRGSDDDNTLNLGASALLAGRFPYSQTTYLGNPLHHFAGAFVLAAPFVLLGTSALQNLFWVPMFFLAVRAETKDSRRALELAWLVLALSPAVMHDIVTGTGYASNAIYVALGLWWLVRTPWPDIGAIAWGVALASRANFLFLVPLAFGWLRQHVGLRAAVRAMVVTCLTVALLTVPFYVHDPRNFGPLDAASRLIRFDTLLPHLGIALAATIAVLSVACSLTAMDAAALFRNCALVQAFPVVAGIVLSSVQDRQLNLSYARYGAFFAWFMLMALVAKEPARAAAPDSPSDSRQRAAVRSAHGVRYGL
jgi:hypothetical protein